jgi:hypothetical protein
LFNLSQSSRQEKRHSIWIYLVKCDGAQASLEQ